MDFPPKKPPSYDCARPEFCRINEQLEEKEDLVIGIKVQNPLDARQLGIGTDAQRKNDELPVAPGMGVLLHFHRRTILEELLEDIENHRKAPGVGYPKPRKTVSDHLVTVSATQDDDEERSLAL